MYSSKELRRFNHLISETDAAYHRAAVRLGLSDSAFHILYTLSDSGGSCLLREMCRLTGISKQTLHSAIRKLQDDGILSIETVGGRSRMLHLTPEGERLAAATVLPVIGAENSIFASWPPEEVERYLSMTQRYLEMFREKTRDIQRCDPG